jgi:hypothetical protein
MILASLSRAVNAVDLFDAVHAGVARHDQAQWATGLNQSARRSSPSQQGIGHGCRRTERSTMMLVRQLQRRRWS